MPIKNDFEHGTVDDTVTTGNSGDAGMGNTAANLVQVTAGHAMIYDDDWAAHGTRSVKITSNTTAGTYLRFTPDTGDRQVASVYFRIPAYPTGGSFPIVTFTGTSSGCKIVVGTTGTISAQNAAGTGIAPSVSTYTLALNTTARLDVECVKGTTTSNGTISYRLWVGANVEGTTTPDAEWTSGATVNAGVNQNTQVFVGKGTSAATAASVSIDDFRCQALGSGWIAPLGAEVADSRTSPGLGKVALIGDSQFDQFPTGVGTGEALIRAALVARGWVAGDVWFHGVGGKTLTTADSTGTTTIQDVAAARAAIGEPDLWVINLGGNSSGVSEATFRAGVQGILNAIGDTHRVVWFGIQGNPNTTARANATVWLRSEVQARPLGKYVDTQAWIHDGRDETGIWQGDAIHFTPTGYGVRNPWVADTAWAARREDQGFDATVTVTPVSATGSVRSGGSVASVTTTVVGAGRKAVTRASTAAVSASTVQAGRKAGRGASTAPATATTVQAGRKTVTRASVASASAAAVGVGRKLGRGASVALTTAAPAQAGRKLGRGAGLANTTVTAVGAGVHPVAGAGGSTTGVSVTTVGAGVARRVGNRIVTVNVTTAGAGTKPAADVRAGGSTAGVAVSVAAAGKHLGRGGSTAGVTVTAVSPTGGLPPDPGDLVLASSGPTRNPFTVNSPRRA